MLLHLDSAKFLACHDHESKYEKENFLVTLDEYTSDATRFKIVPAYKYQSDGDMLIYNNESVEIIRAQAFRTKYIYFTLKFKYILIFNIIKNIRQQTSIFTCIR